MSVVPPPFSAVVLAGGRSTRMGTDKASLLDRAGQPLLLRQLALLAAIHPAELFVSARSGQVLPPFPAPARRVDDDGSTGPLGAIVAVLEASATDRLLVIAVDLPELDEPVLRRLLANGDGVVPHVAGRPEPLVAIYPRRWLPHARAALAEGVFALQHVLATSAALGYFSVLEFSDPRPFLNWNQPSDFVR